MITIRSTKLRCQNFRSDTVPGNLWLVSIAIFITALSSGCLKEEPPEPEVIAKVGDRILTASEISTWEISLNQPEVPQEVRSEFIRRWVEEEILYQAAVERKFDSDPWVVQRIDELSRTLAVTRMLELETNKLTSPSISEVKEYFQEHSSEFVWSHVHLVIDYWSSDNRNGMDRLRSNLLRGNNTSIWSGDIGTLDNARISLDGPESTTPEIWNVIHSMKIGATSQVHSLNDRLWVFKLIERYEPGEPKGFDNVQDEIKARLMDNLRHQQRDNLIRSLVDEYQQAERLQWSNYSSVITVMDTTNNDTTNITNEYDQE